MKEELRHELVRLTYSPEIVSFELTREQGLEILEEIKRLNNILEEFEEDLEREINIKEEDLKIEHNKYININTTLRKMSERFKELKGVDKE